MSEEPREGWVEGRKRVLRSRIQLLWMIALAPRSLVVGAIVAALLAGVLPILLIIAGGVLAARIEDALGSPRAAALDRVYPAFVLVVGLFLLAEIMVPLQRRIRWLLSRRVDGSARDRVMRASLLGSDMARLHSPKLLEAMRRLRGFVWYSVTPGSGAAGMLGIARDYVSGFAAAVVVAWFQPIVAIASLVVSLVERVRLRNAEQAIVRAWIDGGWAFAEARYFTELGLGRPSAAEVRMFGLGDWLRSRIEAAGIRGWHFTWRSRTRAITGETPLRVVLTTAVAGVGLAWAAFAAGRRDLSVPELIVFVPALFTVLGMGNTFPDDNNVEYGTVMLPALETVERLAAEAGLLEAGSRPRPGVPAAPTVELRNVSFGYPGAESLVLRDVDLTIPSGTSATLVGMNGAGKTTLVRLMCGLYRPSSGEVLVDGVDLRELDLDRWHAETATMFQEFVRLPTSVADNVGAGAVDRLHEVDAVRGALHEANALGFSTALRDGLGTKLATKYAEGADVSGGQWQRLGVARALFALRAGARFLVLDEPTSNLDTASEERLVQRLLDETRGTCTAVLVTHRLGLARRTDQILVVEDGRIVERGRHDELIALGGRYARAFEMQASLYPLGETTDGP